jgi:hypothetical protein
VRRLWFLMFMLHPSRSPPTVHSQPAPSFCHMCSSHQRMLLLPLTDGITQRIVRLGFRAEKQSHVKPIRLVMPDWAWACMRAAAAAGIAAADMPRLSMTAASAPQPPHPLFCRFCLVGGRHLGSKANVPHVQEYSSCCS